jgi:hypothetical protein
MAMFGFGKRTRPQRTAPQSPEPPTPPVVIELVVPKVQDPDPTPDALRKQLFAAAVAGDEEKLVAYCRKYKTLIFERGVVWSQVPEKIRSNSKLMSWYISGLRAIVRSCADRMGQPELFQHAEHAESSPDPKP